MNSSIYMKHYTSPRLITAGEKSDTFTDRLGLLFEVNTLKGCLCLIYLNRFYTT